MTALERCDEIVRAIDDVLWTETIVRRFCGAVDPSPMFTVVGVLEYVAADDALVTS